MIWLTWRQMRAQTLWTAALVAAAGAYLLYLAFDIREAHRLATVDCAELCSVAQHTFGDQYRSAVYLLGLLLIAGPALIGAFWGAPLIARELEAGTHRLAWNQSVTRTRWLAVKLALVGGVSVALTGSLSLLLSWAAEPFDDIINSRFEPLTFASRGLAPFGYALLAFSIGVVIGLFTRKTLAAMAVTLVVFAGYQLLMANVVREHFAEPVTQTVTWADADTLGTIDSFGIGPAGAGVQGYTITGAWVISDYITVYKGDGSEVTSEDITACGDSATGPEECMMALDASFEVVYHPADRYWTFQWLELGAAAALSAVLIGLAFWRFPRGLN